MESELVNYLNGKLISTTDTHFACNPSNTQKSYILLSELCHCKIVTLHYLFSSMQQVVRFTQ